MTALRQLKAWSHSRLLVFEACKLRAWLQFGERIPDPKPRPNADRGTLIHDGAEKYVRGKLKDMPAECAKHYRTEFEALKREFKAGKVSLEGEWAFDDEWNPTDWRDKNAWTRVKCDAVAWLTPRHVLVVDYKSGKRFGNEVKHGEQMQLYLLSILLRFPDADEVTVELWYLDHPQSDWNPTRQTFTREQGMRYLAAYTKRGKKMTTETQFPPNPNIFSCKWCPYGPDGTGHCKAGVKAGSVMRRPQPTTLLRRYG